jgi:predicted HicB family RNase H-like nuclease
MHTTSAANPATTRVPAPQERLQLRIPRGLHARLRHIARRKGVALRALLENFLLEGVKHYGRKN